MTAKPAKHLKSKLWTCAGVLALAAAFAPAANAAEEQTVEFNLPAQSLENALKSYGVAADRQVMVSTDLVEGKRAPAIAGDMTPDAALEKILSGSGLVWRVTSSNVVLVGDPNVVEFAEAEKKPRLFRVAQANSQDAGAVATVTDDGNADDDKKEQRDTIVVTGTSIRGVYPEASPLDIYTADDIGKTGATTVEQFIQDLPQNLSNITSTAPVAILANSSVSRNSINLRGLGTGATLVLLNGRRLVTPGGESPDISLIPLGAVDRIEVLSDGASAVYGSDAIGGVVNIVLRGGESGADTRFSYGTVTDGSHRRLQADQALGVEWDTGDLFATYGFYDQSVLNASDREFAASAAPFSLIPEEQRHSATISINQELTEKLSLAASTLYTDRRTDGFASRRFFGGAVDTFGTHQEQVFVSASATYELAEELFLEAFGTYSTVEEFLSVTGLFPFESTVDASSLEIGGKLDGTILALPGGDLGFSVGGGYYDENYDLTSFSPSSGRSNDGRDRKSTNLYAEVFAPLISSEQDIRGIRRLEFGAAIRYTDYSDFGSDMSPRFSLLWSPIEGVAFRGTYSEGFRAPSLSALLPSASFNAIAPYSLFTGGFDPFSSDGSSILLFLDGTNNIDYSAERADSFTGGVDIEPVGLDGLKFSVTYFNIDYNGRLDRPDPTGFALFFMPESFPESIIINPSAEDIASGILGSPNLFNTTTVDPTDANALAGVITVIADNRKRNLAISKIDGLDFSLDYRRSTDFGDFAVGSHITYIIDSFQQSTPTSDRVALVNTVANPVDFRMRSYVGFSRDGFGGQLNVDYYDDYSNPFVTPTERVAGYTELGLNLVYDFSKRNNWILNDLSLSLNIANLLDRDPPFVNAALVTNAGLAEPVGFDPANGNPVGRLITFGLKKKW